MKFKAASLAALGMLCLQTAHASPTDYVYTPTVEAGETEIDFKFGTEDNSPRESMASLGLGHGVNDWWFTEAYVKYAREGSGGIKYDAFEWENKFQLTETGKYPVDIGLITEIEIPKNNDEGIEFKFGPLFQSEFGKLQLNGNVLFEKHFDAAESAPTEMAYQWQAKYRWLPSFEYGMQGFGEMGEWNHWESSSNQEHKIGPAIFGKLAMSHRTAIKYNAAWLFGLTENTPDNTFRLQTELEF